MKCSLTFLFVLCVGASGAEYFLAPGGNDWDKGTRREPWQSIEKVNETLLPGDTATFLPGRYSGNILPKRSGAPDAPITYRASEPGKAVLTGGTASEYAALLKDRHHIVLDGFRFEVKPGTRWLRLEDATHCVIRNCHMENSTMHNPIQCRNVRYSRFENLKAFQCNWRGPDGQIDHDMWNNYNISHCVFDRLYISRVGHCPFGLEPDCEKIVIRDSVFDGRWGRNFEFFSPKNVLMERCVITNAMEGSGSADGRAKLFVYDSIFRYNLIIRNGYCPLVINAYKFRDRPAFGMKRSRLYFNTWHLNQDGGWQMVDMSRPDGVFMVEDNIVKNNIFSDNNPGDGTALLLADNIAPDNLFINNLLRGRQPGDKTVKITWPRPVKTFTAAEANTARAGQFRANFDADPGFTDPEHGDYTLKPGSPAIGRGEALTTVTVTGKSIYLPVRDSKYFYDGYQIPGETGDRILVGQDRRSARVIRNDTEENVLVLDSPLEFTAGDTVNLAYSGKSPDLGAYQTGQKSGPVFDDQAIRQLKMDTATEPVIVCDFEEERPERWFYLWKHWRQPNSTAMQDRTVAATGQGSWKVFFRPNDHGKNQAGSVLSTHICPPRWVIDRFPYVTFSYRIPPGVPMGVSIHADAKISAANEPEQLFLGGSPALQLKGRWAQYENLAKINLIDDDRWHTVTVDVRAIRKRFPEVKMLSRLCFWTPGCNGKPGDCYWLDDLVIHTEEKNVPTR